MIHFKRRLGASWSTDQKPVGFVALPADPSPVQSGDASLRTGQLIPGHYLKRPKPISYPYGDVLLAKYRACARGHVLELQRVTNQRQKSRGNASPTLGKSNIAPLNPKRVRGPTSGQIRRT